MQDPIHAYSRNLPTEFRMICEALRELIEEVLTDAKGAVWHGSPVWFIGENPVVGYSATAKGVNLLFWNGKALKEPSLKAIGKYRAAQVTFFTRNDLSRKDLHRMISKAGKLIFDSRSFFERKRKAAKRRKNAPAQIS